MNTRIFSLLHAGLGVVLAFASMFGAASARTAGDSNSVTLGLLLALAFGLAAVGFWVRSRLLAAVPAVLILVVAGMFSSVMLFAPLAWGESNMRTLYVFQGVLLLVMALEVTGLIAIFRKGPAGVPDQAG